MNMKDSQAKTGQGGVPWADDQHCLVCGKENPIGLKLDFVVDGDVLRTTWVADKRFQGYENVLHGGMIALILDETMVNLPWKKHGVPVISAELTTRFLKPARIGDTLHFSSELEDLSKRVIVTRGRCVNAAGELVAEASAKCVRIKNPNL
ncbi:MAG: PaaI family thioesterase [candidate division FCPU426 bacterium]